MGYLHIDNLYKSQEILAFKQCYALEKIHGTSAHIKWDGENVHFFSGGEKHENFIKLFNEPFIKEYAIDKIGKPFTIFGEAYGGKCQGMSKTYGKELKFIAFDVQIEDVWLSVEKAEGIARAINLEFVYWTLVNTDIETLNGERDRRSMQAVRNGIGLDKMQEGVVLRPIFEVTLNNGKRLIVKHKREEFSERASIPEIDPTKRQLMENAEVIANEWVTPMRMRHVLDKLGNPKDITKIGEVIKAMVEDVTREAEGEITDNKTVRSAIGTKAALMYKEIATRLEV
jgi:hypothetical protein